MTSTVQKLRKPVPNSADHAVLSNTSAETRLSFSNSISDTIIPGVISKATDRSISLLESKVGHNIADVALIDIIEKIVPFLTTN